MRKVEFKYKVGDRVKFAETFAASASIGLRELAGTTAVIEECRDYNGPAYQLSGYPGFFKQSCFVGLADQEVL